MQKTNLTEIMTIRFTKAEKEHLEDVAYGLDMPMNAVVRYLVDLSAGVMKAQQRGDVYEQ